MIKLIIYFFQSLIIYLLFSIGRILGIKISRIFFSYLFSFVGPIFKSSKIIDKNLKFRGLKNVFCCSSAVFPTSGSANPTLVICALAQRLSAYLNRI